MKVYVLVWHESYGESGVYGVYESMDAAIQHQRLTGLSTEIEEFTVEGVPRPAAPSESAVNITRKELGLKAR